MKKKICQLKLERICQGNYTILVYPWYWYLSAAGFQN